MRLLDKLKLNHHPRSGALDLLKYIGPGLLVTVGFIDPGNWATNLAAGSEFGYALLWVVTFSSIMLIIIQHNVAHLGIVTGLCLAEATTKYLPKKLSRPILISAMLASISTVPVILTRSEIDIAVGQIKKACTGKILMELKLSKRSLAS